MKEKIEAYFELCDFSMELHCAGRKLVDKEKKKSQIMNEAIQRMHNENLKAKTKILKSLGEIYGV